jgi:hypothetical protein
VFLLVARFGVKGASDPNGMCRERASERASERRSLAGCQSDSDRSSRTAGERIKRHRMGTRGGEGLT